MAETLREEEPTVVSVNTTKSKLRYPLRSAVKSKAEKVPVAESANSSASRRGRTEAPTSKSVSVLDLSGKEKAGKPPRRLSVPAKSTVGSVPKAVGNITPISETRAKRSVNAQGRSETPLSDVSRASSRKRFSALSSASYWLSQIKLSESAAKHSVSLGFFKLALEAGCEPLQRMRDELKSYARRHNLGVLGETVKELFESYNITETSEQLQVSEAFSQVPEEGTRSSDDEVHSSSSTDRTRKLKPKSLNTDATQVSTVPVSSKKEATTKKNPATGIRASLSRNSGNTRSVPETGNAKTQKKPQKPTKGKDSNKQRKKSTEEEGTVSPALSEDKVEGNKENMDSTPVEDICV
ncbi:uncharacterized protein LOC123210677 isoform X2 [Mangifera indica]|uniref:uncharacterized protein LOC123210677 isoform X2 n=1 Tax=Mangifera indica TaxID=29780 RepID=UPI001CFA8D6B|nr:uncharacterized protein LOC123210677 isoform X2 [Mangifera indica]